MGGLEATYKVDGRGVEPGSAEAWRIVAEHYDRVRLLLEELPVGLVPEELRLRHDALLRALHAVWSLAGGIAAETERYFGAGKKRGDALQAALVDARFQGRLP